MSDKIGGISLDEIMKAATEDLKKENDVLEGKKEEDFPEKDTFGDVPPDIDPEEPVFKKPEKPKGDSGLPTRDKPEDKVSGEFVSNLRKIPFVDMLYRTVQQKNWGLLIWIILNLLIIANIFALLGMAMFAEVVDQDLGAWIGFILGIVLYFATLGIALSPVGEFILRQQNSCRKIKNKDIRNKIEPIFQKVYEEARIKNPELSKDVKLFMCDDESANAFATGKRTVCITRGLADMDEEHIAGILAHEFGHLANKDTDCILMVVVANLILTAITLVLGLIINFISDVLDDGKGISGSSIVLKIFKFLWLTIPLFIWTKFGALLCLRGNRNQEYAADHYAAELGYAQQLIDAFVEIEDAPSAKGLWKTLLSSHPDTADRVMKLNEYMGRQNSTIK